jgi:hypothetical protein
MQASGNTLARATLPTVHGTKNQNPSIGQVFQAFLARNTRQCLGFAYWCSAGARLQSATPLSTHAIENRKQHLWPCELRTALSIFLMRDGP